jgi:hypothetical protein
MKDLHHPHVYTRVIAEAQSLAAWSDPLLATLMPWPLATLAHELPKGTRQRLMQLVTTRLNGHEHDDTVDGKLISDACSRTKEQSIATQESPE